MLLALLNCYTQFSPKRNPAPRGDIDHPYISSGSDHIKSHIAPLLGIYCFLSIPLISSKLFIEGDNPPCTHNTLLSIMAAIGR